VAVLQLDHAVDVQPIQPAGRAAKPGDRVMLCGWGADQPDGSGPLPTRLQQLSTRVLRQPNAPTRSSRPERSARTTPTALTAPVRATPAVELVDGVPKLVGTGSRAVPR
jgi:hypothetical protein